MDKKSKKLLGENAVEQTLALNPLVGISAEEILGAARTTAFQAVRQPLSVMRAGLGFTRKLVEVALGDREYKPAPRDRRFADATWSKSAIHRGALQSYLAFVESLDEWVDDAGFSDIDKRRAQFITKIVGDSMSPTNAFVANPAAIKQLVETGGQSVLQGFRNFIDDRRNNNGMPLQVDKTAFQVGENLATTEGAVVFRNELLELIQYTPKTEKVSRRPMLFIPPQINKFYVFDLDEQKSWFQYCVNEGIQTFTISWRNPGPEHADWGIDQYIEAIKEAIDVVKSVSGSQTLNVCAACSGGITASILAAHLNALGDKSINSLTLLVCVLEQKDEDNDLAPFINDAAIEAARVSSRRKGVLRGADLAKIFAWMRPNELVWNYFVNNYLMGNQPPTFDILYWNNDTTNLPAQLHSDFLDILSTNALARPGDVSVCNTDIDLTRLDTDMFLVGGLTDHLTPWNACYRTTRLAGGEKEFVLVGSGHIQSLVSPPGNPKARYFTNPEIAATADEWLDGAEEHQGTWWPRWSEWVRTRSGALKKAPAKPGNKKYPALCDAPGTYVHDAAA